MELLKSQVSSVSCINKIIYLKLKFSRPEPYCTYCLPVAESCFTGIF